MNLYHVRSCLPLCLLMTASALSAGPMPAPNLSNLVRSADVIVVGSIESVSEYGSAIADIQGQQTKVQLLVAEMVVDHVLKGAAEGAALRIRFVAPAPQNGYSGLSRGTYRLVFLKRSGTDYELASPYYPSVLAVPMPAPEGADPAEKVGATLGNVIESPFTYPVDKRAAIYDLGTLRSSTSIAVLRRTLSHADEHVRLEAAAALLKLNDVSGLPPAEKALIAGLDSSGDGIAQSLRYGMSVLSDPRAVPTLSRLMKAGDAETRRAAAAGLRRTHARAAVPALSAALEDADWEVRYYAVIGLAEVTGENAWRPDMDTFRVSEEKYLAYWKERAKREK